MAFEKFKAAYPPGFHPGPILNNLDELDQYNMREANLTYYARSMQTREEIIRWFADDHVERSFMYNALTCPDRFYAKSCLNVYGARMLLENQQFLIRNADGTRNAWEGDQAKEDPKYNGGFNYTGI